jgi:hypothetical protein
MHTPLTAGGLNSSGEGFHQRGVLIRSPRPLRWANGETDPARPGRDRAQKGVLMEKAIRLRILGSLAVVAALALPSGSAMAATPGPAPYTCGGGSVGGGTYASLTITGFCDVVPGAVITIVGNLTVAPGAFFDAQSSPSTITVGHNVTAGQDSIMGLGCQPFLVINGRPITSTGHPCSNDPAGHSVILVKGNLATTNASLVLLNGITVNGNVALDGNGSRDLPFGIPTDWSIKNNTVGGNLSVSDINADWLGVMRNETGKNITLTNITADDPGDPYVEVFVVGNSAGWNLNCSGLVPGVSGGFNPTVHNVAGRNVTGQCVGI